MLRGIGIQMDGPYSMAGEIGRGDQIVIVERSKESLANRGASGGITSSWKFISALGSL